MRLALDTNRYLDFVKGLDGAVSTLQLAHQFHVPFVVVAELRAGFLHGSRSRENERVLRKFLGAPRVEVLYPDDQTTHHYARLYLQLRRQGTPVPTNDLWIAALVSQHGLTLYSRDRHFDHLPQLPRVPD